MEPNDPVWKLLAQSPLPQGDAWFAARAVARLRRQQRPLWTGRLIGALAWVSSTALVALLAVHFSGSPTSPALHSTANTAKIQEALNFIADRGPETDLLLASSTL